MNSLKKALAKDDIKKYQLNPKRSTHLTMVKQKSISNHNDWTSINNFIECRATYQNTVKQAIHQKIHSLIKKSFNQNQLIISHDILVKSLLSIFEQYHPDQDFDHSNTRFNHKEQKVNHLLEFLQKLINQEQKLTQSKKNQESLTFIQRLQKCVDFTQTYLEQQITKRKEKELGQYDKIISILKPTKKKVQKKQEKRQNIQKLTNKLLHSLSSGNLHIKVTTQEISVQKKDQKLTESKITHKKSQGNLLKTQFENKLKSPKNQGQTKLQNFFKDPNMKIVKTTVEYDYSAILQGGKSNIQYRNKTFDERNIEQQETSSIIKSKNNFEVTNINKAKKDQAFVFYRPKVHKNK